jgi:hypothetical protein
MFVTEEVLAINQPENVYVMRDITPIHMERVLYHVLESWKDLPRVVVSDAASWPETGHIVSVTQGTADTYAI